MQWRFDGASAALRSAVGHRNGDAIEVRAHRGCGLHGPYLAVPAGRLHVRLLLAPGARGSVRLEITTGDGQERLTATLVRLHNKHLVEEVVDLPTDVEGLEVRLYCRPGARFAVRGLELDLDRDHRWATPDPDRPVGLESGKTYADKVADGFVDRYLSGPSVMEVGYKGYDHQTVPIVPQAVGVDVGYPGYDGRRFPFADGSLDAIYSSHCYEHIPDYRAVLRDWYRLLRVGGFLVIVVPHRDMFERKRQMPSRWNPDHQRFYTPRSLLGELEQALDENSYRIRHLVENDKDFDARPTPRDGTSGCFEIELVVEKIRPPHWVLDDGAVRPYPPADFSQGDGCRRVSPYETVLDLAHTGHLVWGPYNRLVAGHYDAEFFFDTDEGAAPLELVLDVARDTAEIASRRVRLEQASATASPCRSSRARTSISSSSASPTVRRSPAAWSGSVGWRCATASPDLPR